MRKLQRLPLSPKARKLLDERARKVADAEDPPAEVERLWEHLELSPMSGGKFVALTPKGGESVEIFGLNRPVLEKGRVRAWRGIERMLWDYEESCSRGDQSRVLVIKQELSQSPFSSVFVWFLRVATGPHAAHYLATGYLTSRCLEVLKKHPEIMKWL